MLFKKIFDYYLGIELIVKLDKMLKELVFIFVGIRKRDIIEGF